MQAPHYRSLCIGIIVIILQTTYSYSSFESHFTKAHELFRNGNHQEALTEYDKALTFNSNCYQAHYNKGLVLTGLGNTHEAAQCYQQALTIEPKYIRALLMLGDIQYRHHAYDDASNSFHKALELEPDNVDALVNGARAYVELHQFSKAAEYLQKAVTLRPHEPNILLDYANVLNMTHQLDEALAVYYRMLAIIPNNPSALYNIAYTLKKKGEIAASLPYYYRSLAIAPDDAESHFGLAVAHLTLGNFDEGWQEYDWRWRRHDNEPRVYGNNQWNGESLAGKTLFIHAEQGLGDTLQFIRYAQVIKRQGATIIAAVQEPLVKLLALCPYLDQVINLHDQVPSFDYHIPLMSIARVMKTRLETIPQEMPYLFADQTLATYWKDSLAQDPHIKIGICWQGNPNYSTSFLRHAVAAKSISLALFAPMAQIPGVSLYSLQRISGTDQLTLLDGSFVVHQFDDTFDVTHGRFMDTAAVIKNLNLIITIDTSICHLAGGLGVPVWLMLPKPADWRWLLDRNDTPWYPSVRIFRQPKPGDWQTVINTIVQELQHCITYYETDSEYTQQIDKASLFEHIAERTKDCVMQQALYSYAQALKRPSIDYERINLIPIIEDLAHVNQELLTCHQAFVQEHPLQERYTRLAQQLLVRLHKRELLKQHINKYARKGTL